MSSEETPKTLDQKYDELKLAHDALEADVASLKAKVANPVFTASQQNDVIRLAKHAIKLVDGQKGR